MEGSWQEMQLGEAVELKRGYDLPKRLRQEGKIPVVSSSGVSGSHMEAKVEGPGVVTGRYGTIGQVFYVEDAFWPLNTTLYVRDFKGNHPRFISYFLRCLDFMAYSDKAAVPGVNRNHLHLASVLLPPLSEQRRIAAVLGALDDKIELNRKMNKTLEEMAQAIFKSWFIDFDGHTDMVDSELGPIPRGWEVGRLGELVEVEKGLSYKGKFLAQEGRPLVNLNSVLEGGGWKQVGLKFYTGPHKEKHMVVPGDIVVANTEQGHKYLLIGCPAVVPRRIGDEGIFTHHLYRVRIGQGSTVGKYWLYHLLLDRGFRAAVTSYTNGTTVNGLFRDGLKRPFVVVPTEQRAKLFESIVLPLHSRVEVNDEENLVLAELRDTLLPKLISGEIRVPEAEDLAEEAL